MPTPPSVSGKGTGPGLLGAIYGTTKAALDRWGVGIANELFADGIAVVELNPGFTATERTQSVAAPQMNFAIAEPPETTSKALTHILRNPMAFSGQFLTSSEVVDKYGL
jgi:short-subunit dehydrogenase